MQIEKNRGAKTPVDEALLYRVQQENQRRILGKLLHDLRNPVHSLRITIELFGRLARRRGDVDVLLERAARYIEPAEAALNTLVAVTGRFGLYLSPPAAPALAQVCVGDCLNEIALLLNAGHDRRIAVTLHKDGDAPDLQIEADRPRLSHALLHHCGLSDGAIELHAVLDEADVRIEVHTDGGQGNEPGFTADEFRQLIENAGGALTVSANRASLRFRRSAPTADRARA